MEASDSSGSMTCEVRVLGLTTRALWGFGFDRAYYKDAMRRVRRVRVRGWNLGVVDSG